jgi:hypothetical protein
MGSDDEIESLQTSRSSAARHLLSPILNHVDHAYANKKTKKRITTMMNTAERGRGGTRLHPLQPTRPPSISSAHLATFFAPVSFRAARRKLPGRVVRI